LANDSDKITGKKLRLTRVSLKRNDAEQQERQKDEMQAEREINGDKQWIINSLGTLDTWGYRPEMKW